MDRESIFVQALSIPAAADRARFLEEQCEGNAALRAEMDSLLAAHEGAGSFLEKPPAELAATMQLNADLGEESWQGLLSPTSQPGSIGVLGDYQVEELLGRGGMGVVLKARDPKLNRTVAIKLLAPELAANAMAVRRFLREAQAAAAVSHDHVMTIHAIDETAKPPLIVMEYIPGQSLQQKIDREGALDLKSILRIGMQSALALAAAHRQGLVHRDVKPSNILLENGVERVKLGDFGLARAVDDVGITRTGQITGTPQYMSPEQAQGESVDHRSDLFSLGCVLYAMCTGRAAFRADSAVAVLHRVIHEHPKPIAVANPEVPDWLGEIVDVLLEKDPQHRFQTAEEVAELLEAHLAHLQTPETVPQPARLPMRKVTDEAAAPETVMGDLFHGLDEFFIQFAFIAVAFGISYWVRSNFELAGFPFIALAAVLVIAVLWISEQWQKWKVRWQGHGDKGRRSSAKKKWAIGGVVVVGGVFVLFDSHQIEHFIKRSMINLGIAQQAPDRRSELPSPKEKAPSPESSAQVLTPLRTVELKPASGFLPDPSSFPNSPILSPDQKSLAWISRDKENKPRILVFDVDTGTERFQLKSTEEVAAFSPDGKTIAFCGHSTDNNPKRSGGTGGVWLADAKTGELQTFLHAKLHPSNVRSLTFDSQGKQLALGHAHNWTTPSGWKGLVSIWDVETKKEIRVLQDHDFRVLDASFSPDGQHVIVLGEDGQLMAWKDDLIVAQYQTQVDFARPPTAISPDGKTYAVSSYSNESKTTQVLLWDWQANTVSFLPTAHKTSIGSLGFSPAGRYLATGDMGTTGRWPAVIRIHDVVNGKELAVLKGHGNWMRAVAFDDQGQLISASLDGTVKWWNVQSALPAEISRHRQQEELIDSKILLAEFQKFAMEHAKSDAKKINELAKPFAAAMGMAQMRVHDPNFLRVTRQQEADFEKGVFDDDAAKRRIDQMLKSINQFGVQFPTLTNQIIREYKAGGLNAARLEIAAHLIRASLAQVKSQLGQAVGEEASRKLMTNETSESETLFRRFERNMQQQKAVSVIYDGVMETKTGGAVKSYRYGGAWQAQPKGLISTAEFFPDGTSSRQTVGVSVSIPDPKFDPAPYDFHINPHTRAGFVKRQLEWLLYPYEKSPLLTKDTKARLKNHFATPLWVNWPVSRFEMMSSNDPAGTATLAYRLDLTGGELADVRLTINTETLAPLSRSLRFSIDKTEYSVRETYRSFSTAPIEGKLSTDDIPAAILINGRVEESRKAGEIWVPADRLKTNQTYIVREAAEILNFKKEGKLLKLKPGQEFRATDNGIELLSAPKNDARSDSGLGQRKKQTIPVNFAAFEFAPNGEWLITGGLPALSKKPFASARAAVAEKPAR